MIQPTSNLSGFYRTDAIANSVGNKTPAPNAQSETGDRLSSSHTDALRSALSNAPEVRPEVVARGRKLAADSTYPPLAIIQQLSKLLTAAQDLSDKVD